MKNYIKIFSLTVLAGLVACEDPETPKPVPATEASDFSAKFLFINATPDAPALDLYLNNVKAGATVAVGEGQAVYTTVPLTSNAVIANTNIRSKASTGTIGGTLGSNDLIYRAGNNNANNFTATNGFSYTVIALDSISRPQPLRTLNSKNVGDITYYSYKSSFTAPKIVGGGDTTIYLNVKNFGVDTESSSAYASANPVTAFNLVKKYNGNTNPSFMTPIGVVPLGSSDVGGPRYFLWRDFFPTYAAGEETTKSGFRVLNASPSLGTLRIVLKFVSGTGADIPLNGSGSAYIMSNAGGQTPSVGSNTPNVSAANFTLQTIAPGGVPNTYTIEVRNSGGTVLASLPNVTFTPGSNYTIVASGFVNGTGSEALKITEVKHN
ncbi:MAG: DUF4397 domain-containing protein [Cyclobacteriaceae bacterium]|nr:DUF4397 domain-containing protein [Cyclobacteriaceae bacterium]